MRSSKDLGPVGEEGFLTSKAVLQLEENGFDCEPSPPDAYAGISPFLLNRVVAPLWKKDTVDNAIRDCEMATSSGERNAPSFAS